ncbi:acetyl-CoA carboxylase, carboxyltransferase subunit beta [Clostridium oryzae]|uniref:Acetyl-coenzyme A carboxylase carboxyl transferase subunit beta n=1 Tax=Clostridium oryzae TaxID=1450648 RepID=A0A1V4IV06_9CLOT|nr:acetyl-CoA carboxylase, carboxyltransferase subunit beta [Clostridium oryzae]OPJ63614.1 acetyl-coenzyme A carboxylase carboxyl transferase subunit beta [Clostridium oryzae]
MLRDLFKKNKYITVSTTSFDSISEENKPIIPDGLWVKCSGCGKILYKDDIDNSYEVCPYCNYHFRLSAYKRIEYLVDKESFEEFDKVLSGGNPIKFKGYEEKVAAARESSGINEAVVTGIGKIDGEETVIGVMDSHFMMGSMGYAVGEKLARAFEYATENAKPIIVFTTSGGARMQEGIISLMQMAKVSAAAAKHSEKGLLYITVLTDPTTGGVTASFAMQGDIILAEPKALVGFAGKRVIKGTINQELPEGFQSAEFLLKKGFIDEIVERKYMKSELSKILRLHKER